MKLIEKIEFKIVQNYFKKHNQAFDLYPIDYSEPQDIFICGYPKSGNTWMQNLLAGVLYGISTKYLPDNLVQELIPDVHYKQYYKRFLQFSIFKSHYSPQPEYKKVIHLIRDGRDAIVSYYAMNQALGIKYSLEEMVIEGKGIISKWHEHTQAWIENPYKADILVIKYEDLHADPLNILLKICHFIDIDRDIDLLNRAISGNTFAKMQEKEDIYGFSTFKNKSERFIRRGKIGSYKDEMPSELTKHFENVAKMQLDKFGYAIAT